jgi:hypothetical protein
MIKIVSDYFWVNILLLKTIGIEGLKELSNFATKIQIVYTKEFQGVI